MKLKLLSFLLILVLAACSGINVTTEEAVVIARDTFESGIIAEPKETNYETDLFNYYLPLGLNVEEASENNLILNKGNQIYLIFSNPAEDDSSKVNYEQDKTLAENAILNETSTNDDEFSYIIVTPYENHDYKLIVGIGGDKGTTITSLANIENSIEVILDILKSIKYK